MLSTAEAAKLLNISPRRVRALVESGDLKAQRVGRAWLIDEDSARQRANAPVSGGRPKDGERDAYAIGSFILMNRNHEVARFEFNKKRERVVSLEPLADSAWAPLGACSSPGKLHPDFLQQWIANRSIPEARPHVGALLEEAGFANVSQLVLSSLGLSLSDQYWFKPVDSKTGKALPLNWKDINYFDNGFDDGSGATLMGAVSSGGTDRAPSNTTNGMLEKRWVMREEKPWLVKGSTPGLNREPFSELLASKLFERMLGPEEFVPYELSFENGKPYSLCPDMLDSRQELIPANDVVGCHGLHNAGLYESYVAQISEMAGRSLRESIDKMIVCDYLMANDDRHLFNFGLIRDVESLQVLGCAPLYDSGCAFFARATLAQLRVKRYFYDSHPFRETPYSQLALVEDFSWFEPEKLDGFTDEVREVLSQNEDLTEEFVELAVKHVQRNIDKVVDLALELKR